MTANDSLQQTGLIAWFARNTVAANLLMLTIIVCGLYSAFTIRKQTTPDFELNMVNIRVPYLGAAPQEVEEGVVVKVEEAIQDLDGIVTINSSAREGLGSVTAEIANDADLGDVMSSIKTRVDAIDTFPALAERPVIYEEEVPVHVVFLSVHGNMDEFGRKILANDVRNELMALPSINQVQILGEREYEISIEVSEHILRQYGLTMSEVSQAIQASSLDLPGGTIRTEGGDILLRTEGQVYTGAEFGELVLRTFSDGTRLTLGEIATIRDGFEEDPGFGRFDGEPTVMLRVLASGGENELATAKAVKTFIEEKAATLPDGVSMDMWIDRSHYLKGRLTMMLKNMAQGAVLVFLMLTLFLRLKVAFWVVVGIPITFCGALWLMPLTPSPVTINVISLFGFILVLGIVVDDAIIIGESVYTQIRADGHTVDNVIIGAKRVAVAATFGVLTTMAAFAPMLFIGTIFAPFFITMSTVVILCLIFSLIESKLILPAHLAHARIPPVDEKTLFDPNQKVSLLGRIPRFFKRFQRRVQHGLQKLIHGAYVPLLQRTLDNRGVTASLFLATLILTIGLLASGNVRTVLLPDVPSDFIQVNVEMQNGTAPEVRNAALNRIETAAMDVSAEYVAANPGAAPPVFHIGTFTRSDNEGVLFVEMPLDDNRALQGEDVVELWRDKLGEIPGMKTLDFTDANNIGGGAPLSFKLVGQNYPALESAAKELEARLAEYNGVFDIRNSISAGGEEIRLSIKPAAEALGLTMSSLGRQVRQAFYGEEAQRIQRGKDEVRVMVRYPMEQRRSVADLENMRIRTPNGDEVPIGEVADIEYGTAFSSISRQNRNRTVTVSADMDPLIVEPGVVIKEISEEFIPEMLNDYQGVDFALEGASQEQQEFVGNLAVASLAAIFLIYALIAIPLRSYSQPLLIMAVIPFGLTGAVIGHIAMDRAISMFSLFGLIALAGVVVNDSLIMVDFINRARQAGVAVRDAVIQSGVQRFRAIILTSLTTSAGLMPILLEKSTQAQYVIPMAISLSFGILFATVITLFLVPALYLMMRDFRYFLRNVWALLMGRDAPEPIA